MRIPCLAGAVLGLGLALALSPVAADEIAIVPNPASLERQEGAFGLAATTPLVVPPGDAEALNAAKGLASILQREHGLKLSIVKGSPRDGAIAFVRAHPVRVTEGYRLDVDPKRVTLSASDSAGFFYAAITLSQLNNGNKGVPAVVIEDAPRFRWRGLMLDSARHYQSPAFVKKLIDAMAMNKLNTLHWHLTDDQAWRIEIKKYPKLTSVGAWRVPAGQAAQKDIDPKTGKPRLYGGFYSQAQVREIVAYAAERAITIVPEIEMPGHATAAIAAYPWLAAIANPPKAVPADWGIYPHAYNLDDRTFRFLEDVLDEVLALFPSTYVHVGGDEVEKAQWKASAAGQARMKALGTEDPEKLQAYFTERIAKYVASKKRRLVGWDEILEPGLPKAAVVMSWRGVDGALKAAAQGHDTILAAHPTLYFDSRTGARPDEPPGRGTVISLKDVYAFEPMPERLSPAERRHVLGLQGQVWTEHVRTEERVAHMTFPRSAAVAELGWSNPGRRQWRDFLRRVSAQFPRYEALGFPVADSGFAPRGVVTPADIPSVALANGFNYGEIRYTLDGTEPTAKSPRYEGPVSVARGAALRATTFDGERRISRARTIATDPAHATRKASQQLKLCSENIALSLEDDAPLQGPRAAFLVDIQNPCWIYEGADLTGVKGITASVGQVPFNYQIGELVKKITFPKPATPEGELEVRLGCEGELVARLPLAPAAANMAVTVLPTANITPRTGRVNLCMRFSQPALEPFWVLDAIELAK